VSAAVEGELPPVIESRILVTIITGFLGSGKTTLLNHLLTAPHGRRIAVLINEFGDVDIDGRLVVSADRDMLELSNGCICCSMNDGLIAALERLLAREAPFDSIVIETTGIADPVPVAATFVRPEFASRMRVDAILAVADAEHFALERFEDPAARNQIRYADVVLLNKADLVDATRLSAVEAMIREVNPTARILPTERSQVAIPLVLGIGGTHATEVDEGSAPSEPGHRHAFRSISFSSDVPLDPVRFQAVLEGLPAQVFRAKGFLQLAGVGPMHIFHLVGRRFTLEEAVDADRGTRLVFIGTDFDRDALLGQLRGCEEPQAVIRAGESGRRATGS
jgi:G3E family GTPase